MKSLKLSRKSIIIGSVGLVVVLIGAIVFAIFSRNTVFTKAISSANLLVIPEYE